MSNQFDDLDAGWDDLEPAVPIVLPEGRYDARLVRIVPQDRRDFAPAIALEFVVVTGRLRGGTARFFLSFRDRARAKGTLALLELDRIRPSDLLQFVDFDRVPSVQITTLRVESKGRIYANVALIEPSRVKRVGDEPPTSPTGDAA